MKFSNKFQPVTMYLGAIVAITVISISPASAEILGVSDLDLGSGRFWESVLRQFGQS